MFYGKNLNAPIDEEKELPTLGIVIDTANRERIDGDIQYVRRSLRLIIISFVEFLWRYQC